MSNDHSSVLTRPRDGRHSVGITLNAFRFNTYTVGIAQDLSFPDSSFDIVTCVLATHHIPESQRQAAFTEMYRVTKPGGRMLTADMSVMLRHADRRSPARQGATEPGPFEDLATAAGYEIESVGRLPLLSYIVAVRPAASGI